MSLLLALLALFALVTLCTEGRLVHKLFEFSHVILFSFLDLLRPLLKACLHSVEASLFMSLDFKASCLNLHAMLSALELLVVESEAFAPLSPTNGTLPFAISANCGINAAHLFNTQRGVVASEIYKSQHLVGLDRLYEVLASLSRDAIFEQHQHSEGAILAQSIGKLNYALLVITACSQVVALKIQRPQGIVLSKSMSNVFRSLHTQVIAFAFKFLQICVLF